MPSSLCPNAARSEPGRSRSLRPVSGLTLVAPHRPLRRSTRKARRRSGCRCRPIRILPRGGAVDVEIGAKPQRIDPDAPLLFEASHGGEVDQRDHVVRLVHEMPVGRTDQHAARLRNAGTSCQTISSTFGPARLRRGDRPTSELTAVLHDGQPLRLDIQRGLRPGPTLPRASASRTVPSCPIADGWCRRERRGAPARRRGRAETAASPAESTRVSGCALSPLIG